MTTDLDRLREAARVEHRGPQDTDVDMLRRYADNIRRGHQGGGSNLTGAVARTLDVVADLLSQPAPTAESMQTCGVCGRKYPADDPRDTCPVCWPGFGEYTAEPPRLTTDEDVAEAQALLDQAVRESGLESMAPGTTFALPVRWEVGKPGAFSGRPIVRMVGTSTTLYLDRIDPSTIRDVTPPAVTS